LTLIVFLDAFSATVILPLIPYYATAFGIGIAGIGVLIAISPVLELISSPLHRVLSKRFGRRPVLLASGLGIFVGFLLLGAATQVWASTAPELAGHGGAYLANCQVGEIGGDIAQAGVAAYAIDPENAKRLWAVSEEWVGETLF